MRLYAYVIACCAVGLAVIGSFIFLRAASPVDKLSLTEAKWLNSYGKSLPTFTPITSDRERALKPKDSFEECDICPQMVVVPAGSFMMGSPPGEEGRLVQEGPQRLVSFVRAFAVGRFEVTVDEFATFARESGYDVGSKCWTSEEGKSQERNSRWFLRPGFSQGGDHPAACLSWHDATMYAQWLSRKTGKTYRLLTEAEWEYSARSGTTTPYQFGEDQTAICRYGNSFDETAKRTIPGRSQRTSASCDDGFAYTAPVGRFAANGFDLHDLLGNVWEWTEGCYDIAVDLNEGCTTRVVRGGAWSSAPRELRSAFRQGVPVVDRVDVLGFRIARTLANF